MVSYANLNQRELLERLGALHLSFATLPKQWLLLKSGHHRIVERVSRSNGLHQTGHIIWTLYVFMKDFSVDAHSRSCLHTMKSQQLIICIAPAKTSEAEVNNSLPKPLGHPMHH